eukprot:6185213-Pleurochrysis_carterae.AAC.1
MSRARAWRLSDQTGPVNHAPISRNLDPLAPQDARLAEKETMALELLRQRLLKLGAVLPVTLASPTTLTRSSSFLGAKSDIEARRPTRALTRARTRGSLAHARA